ncbi:LamG-like jellyroll fold domain-containing protein [Hamadaea sp. NPDC051192]|uniref:LamG-like jellyroll fold domain-containing protein n=1 Tax=Hamadaea sp. NPDC051192 TaxID=3154940 RepID=UPI0034483217
MVLVLFGLSIGVPADSVPPNGSFPLGWLTSWLSQRPTWASGAGLPSALVGMMSARGGYGTAEQADAHRGNGRQQTKVAKGLDGYKPNGPGNPKKQAVPSPQGFDEKSKVRVPAASTATSTMWRDGKGIYARQVFQEPVNFKAAEGAWQPIDSTLKRATSGRWETVANSWKMSIVGGPAAAASAVEGDTQPLALASATTEDLVSVTTPSGEVVGYSLEGATIGTPTVTEGSALYTDVLPSTDVRIEAQAMAAKETLILHSASVATSWTYRLNLSGVTASINADGEVVFTNSAGDVAVRMPRGYLKDSSFNPQSGEPAYSHDYTYELISVDGEPAVRATANAAWLADPARVFPVYVDPVLRLNTDGDTYVMYGDDVDHSSEDTLKIGTANSGTTRGKSLLHFGDFSAAYGGKHLSYVTLNLFMTWQYNCTEQPFSVYAVGASWSATSVRWGSSTTYGGPALRTPALGTASLNSSAACNNTGSSATIGDWVPVILDVDEFNAWTTGGSTNYGLAVSANSDTTNAQWKRFTSKNGPSGSTACGSRTCAPYIYAIYTDNVLPQVDTRYPASNATVDTLTPELTTRAHDPDSWPTKGVKYQYKVYTDATFTTTAAVSAWQTTPGFKVPAGALAWNKTYYYTVQLDDWSSKTLNLQAYAFSTPVPQPAIASKFSQNPGKGFDPSTGNYTTSATDASIAGVGPNLEIVRYFNSTNRNRDTAAFGEGWTSVIDMRAAEIKDASGAVQTVSVRYPNGQEVAFGRNNDGSFTPPMGRYAVFKPILSGTTVVGYSLTDKDAMTYTFRQASSSTVWNISSITDANARTLTFTYNATTGRLDTMTSESGRSLHFEWALSTAALYYIAKISTDPATVGDAATVKSWTYTVDFVRLMSVCGPVAVACTTYNYATFSQGPNTVLNTGAYSYWRLGDTAGQIAKSSVLARAGADNGLYNNVTSGLGTMSSAALTSAMFNGTTSNVQLPGKLVTDGAYQSISLWFKTTTAGGVLFSYSAGAIGAGTIASNYTPALYIDANGYLRGEFWQGATTPIKSLAPVTNDTWHHVVLAGAGSTQTMYLDNVVQGTLAGTISMYQTGGASFEYLGAGFIGHSWPDHANSGASPAKATYFTGQISDAAFFSKTLSKPEITAMYNAAMYTGTELTKITRPTGRVTAEVTYDAATAKVKTVKDENGSTWTLNAPTIAGDSDVYAASVLGGRPVNYWRLDDPADTTDAVNEVAGGTATYAGTLTFGAAGPFADRTAVKFDGASGSLLLPSSNINFAGPASVSMWFQMPAGSTVGGVLYGYQNGPITDPAATTSFVPALYVGADGKLRGGFWTTSGGSPITSATSVADGKWHHVTIAASTGAQTLYLDGVAVGTKTATLSVPANGYSYLGAGKWTSWAGSSGAVGYFPGAIAEASFFASALSLNDVAAHITASKQSLTTSLTTVGTTVTSITMPVLDVSIVDPAGHTMTSTYDLANGNQLVAMTDAEGNTTRYGYDSGGYSNLIYDADKHWVQTVQDSNGNTIQQITCQEDTTNSCSSTYYDYYVNAGNLVDPRNNQLTAQRDGRSASATDNAYKTSKTYDAQGNLVTITDPVGGVTTTTYTEAPTLTSSTACSSSETADKVFDKVWSGTSTSFCSAEASAWIQAQYSTLRDVGRITIRHAEAGGQAASLNTKDFDVLTSADGGTWTTRKQVRGNTQAISTVTLDPIVQAKYLKIVVVTPTQSGTGAARIYEIEGDDLTVPLGLANSTEQPSGAFQRISYYPNGDVARVRSAAGRIVEYTYDNLGRKTSETVQEPTSHSAPLTTSFVYDAADRLVTQTEPPVLNRVTGATHTKVTTNEYDADGNVLSTTVTDTTGGDVTRKESYTYDTYGRKATYTDAKQDNVSATYGYDLYGHVVLETDQVGGQYRYQIDSRGNVLEKWLVNYDVPGDGIAAADQRLLLKIYSPGGRLATEIDALNGLTEYEYLDNGLLAKKTRTDGGANSFVVEENSYDPAGNLISQKTSNGTTTTTFEYDAAGRRFRTTLDPTGLNRVTTNALNPDGKVTASTAGVGTTDVRSASQSIFDPEGHLLVSNAYAGNPATTPVARWKLNDPSGSQAADTAGNSNINRTGGVTFTGTAATFDGSTGYLSVDDPIVDTSQSFTIAAWVTLADKNANHPVVLKSSRGSSSFYLMYEQATDKWLATGSMTTYSGNWKPIRSTSSPAAGAATHLAVTYDATARTYSMYVNGTLESTVTGVNNRQDPRGSFYIGKYSSYYMSGSIRDVQIYQGAMTVTQIAAVKSGQATATVARTYNNLDEAGNVVTTKDPLGNITAVAYDEADQPAVITGATVKAETTTTSTDTHPTVSIGYNTFGDRTDVRDANGNWTQHIFDRLGREYETRQPQYTAPGSSTPVTPTTTREFDSLNQLTRVTDPVGNETSYGYDQLGRAVSTTAPDDGTTTVTYDLLGHKTSSTDPIGGFSEADYDYMGRQTAMRQTVRQPAVAIYTTTYGYGTDGRLATVTTPTGVVNSYTYNTAGEPANTQVNGAYTTTFTSDWLKSLTETKPNNTHTTSYFDQLGRNTSITAYSTANTALATTSASYDAAGHQISYTDAEGAITTFTYDSSGLLRSQTEPISASDSILTTFGYDAVGNPTRYSDGRANNFWTTYNTLNLAESQIEPATTEHPDAANRTFTTAYDAAGRPVAQTLPGGVSQTYGYDAAGRLTSQTGTGAEAATSSRTATYDLAGRITSISATGSTNNITYDDRGLPLSITGQSGNSAFAYNGDGQMTSRIDAAGTTIYRYRTTGTSKGLLDKIANTSADLDVRFSYNAMGAVNLISYYSAGVEADKRTLIYDDMQRVTTDELSASGGASIAKITYGWDDNGNEISKTTTNFAGTTTGNAYEYDQAGRLIKWQVGSNAPTTYSYDKSGNRTQVGNRWFVYDQRNRLTGDGATTYHYTARGTLSSTQTGSTTDASLSDAFGQVLSQQGNGTTQTYTYDGLGRAIKTGFAYTGLGNDLASDNTATYVRDPGNGVVGAVSAGGVKRLTWTDLHDDIVAQFTATSTTLDASTIYDPLGRTTAGGTSMVGSLGYQSEWTDTQTGRVNMAARWYNTDTGQFDSRDTATNNPTPTSIAANRYQYGNARPLTATDPSGHKAILDDGPVAVKSTSSSTAGKEKCGGKWRTEDACDKYYILEAKKAGQRAQAKYHKEKKVEYYETCAGKRHTVDWCEQYWVRVQKNINAKARAKNRIVKIFSVESNLDAFMGGLFESTIGIVGGLKDLADSLISLVKRDATQLSEGSISIFTMAKHMVDWCLDMKLCSAAAFLAIADSIVDLVKDLWTGLTDDGPAGWRAAGRIVGMLVMAIVTAGSAAALKSAIKTVARNAENVIKTTLAEDAAKVIDDVSGTCRVNSFDPDTRVLMADGSTRPIKDVRPGDEVLTGDTDTGRTEANAVTQLHRNEDTTLTNVTVRDITTGASYTIRTTDEHPFWDATNNRWVDAADLPVGTRLATVGGAHGGVVERVTSWVSLATMYNLTIDDIHTYYVLAGDAPVLVHNDDDNPELFPNLIPKDSGYSPGLPINLLKGRSGNYQYVVLKDGTLVIGKGDGHTMLARGLPVRAAGEVKLKSGRILEINNYSGHYQPYGSNAAKAAEQAFNDAGFDATGKYVERYTRGTPIC